MIIYRLKEDWLSFKAGEKFTTSDYDGLYQLVNDDGKLVLAKIPEDLLDNIGGDGRWKPVDGGKFNFIDEDGDVVGDVFDSVTSELDKDKLSLGNCFRTKEEAQAMVAWLKARQRLIESGAEFINALDVDSDEVKRFEVYLNGDGILQVSECCLRKYVVVGKSLCFSDVELAKQSIREHKDDWLTYLGVREENNED